MVKILTYLLQKTVKNNVKRIFSIFHIQQSPVLREIMVYIRTTCIPLRYLHSMRVPSSITVQNFDNRTRIQSDSSPMLVRISVINLRLGLTLTLPSNASASCQYWIQHLYPFHSSISATLPIQLLVKNLFNISRVKST